MKKILFITLLILFTGCNKKFELIFDPNTAINCYNVVYEFSDGTIVYSDYTSIKYKTSKEEMPIKEAIDKKLIKLSDIEDNKNLKIVKKGDIYPPTCIDQII